MSCHDGDDNDDDDVAVMMTMLITTMMVTIQIAKDPDSNVHVSCTSELHRKQTQHTVNTRFKYQGLIIQTKR